MNQLIYTSALLLYYLLFGMVYSHSCTEDAEMLSSDFTIDPRWRIISGLDAAGIYSLYSQVREMEQPPLVILNTTETDPAAEDSDVNGLHSVIEGVCRLVSFYELVSKTESGSDLHTLLAANVEDSCHWLRYLVTHYPAVSSSSEFESLPPSCTASDTTRLHRYCLQRRIRSEQLRTLLHRTLSDSLNSYYLGEVPAPRARDWVQSSSMSPEQQRRILNII